MHAVTVLANARLQDDLACHASPAELIVLPAVNPGNIPPTDFGHAGQLIRWALVAARTALTAAAPGPPALGMTPADRGWGSPDQTAGTANRRDQVTAAYLDGR